jgi:hypothetical protein
MTDQTLLYLYGFTTLQDQATYLASGATASGTTLNIADATAITRGILEIEDELIWADSVDTQALTITVPPYGRGYRGTTATAHNAGVRVVSSPLFPRSLVKQAINQTIQSVFPDLFAIGETTFTFNPAVSTYSLPAGALDVLQVAWQTIGPSREWMPIRRYRVDKHAATSAFASGVSISLYDAIVPGRTIKVVYTKQPTVLANTTDEFTTVTGLPASTEDVIRLGAAYRMVPFFDSPHLSGMSAEADFAANMRPVGGAAQLGRYLLQVYQVRLAEETKRLQSVYPNRSHFTR